MLGKGLKVYRFAPATHAIGVVLAATRVEHGRLATPGLVQIGYFASATLLMAFSAVGYRVLRNMSERADGRRATAPAQSS